MILREPDSGTGFIKDYTCSKIKTLGKIGFITFIFSTNGPAAEIITGLSNVTSPDT